MGDSRDGGADFADDVTAVSGVLACKGDLCTYGRRETHTRAHTHMHTPTASDRGRPL